jgi:hypothetical protein
MNGLFKVCISAILAQVLFVGTLHAQDPIFSNSFETCFPGDRIGWDGGGDGVSWADPFNWEGDELPADGDSILVQILSQQIVSYDSSLETTVIRCLDSNQALSVTGGHLKITESGKVIPRVTITGGTFTVTGGLQVASALIAE